jgi:hypothetical protein
LEQWMREGPRLARVDSLEVKDSTSEEELTGFPVRH